MPRQKTLAAEDQHAGNTQMKPFQPVISGGFLGNLPWFGLGFQPRLRSSVCTGGTGGMS